MRTNQATKTQSNPLAFVKLSSKVIEQNIPCVSNKGLYNSNKHVLTVSNVLTGKEVRIQFLNASLKFNSLERLEILQQILNDGEVALSYAGDLDKFMYEFSYHKEEIEHAKSWLKLSSNRYKALTQCFTKNQLAELLDFLMWLEAARKKRLRA